MTRDHDARTKLAKLANSLMEDIMAMPDAEIIAEIGTDGIARARALFGKAKQELSKQLLIDAKSQFEAWKAIESRDVTPFDRAAARARFEKIRRGDAAFDRKITLAARNGEAPTDADMDGLSADWADLQRLDGEDEQK
jgi:hypothetical protein